MNEQLQALFFAEVRRERERQVKKWGDDQQQPFSRDKFAELFCAILMEEVGEVARALLEGNEQHALTEMVQVAAVCCRYFELPPGGGSR